MMCPGSTFEELVLSELLLEASTGLTYEKEENAGGFRVNAARAERGHGADADATRRAVFVYERARPAALMKPSR